MPKVVTYAVTEDMMKPANIADYICDDCISELISLTNLKNASSKLVYYLLATALCQDCYNKLLEKHLIPCKETITKEFTNRMPDSLWYRTKQFITE